MKGTENHAPPSPIEATGDPVRPLDELCAEYTNLDAGAVSHLQHLVASWGMLADLSFADILLFVPLAGEHGRFVVLGLARPTTGQTLYSEDPIGSVIDETVSPYVARCWRGGEFCSGEVFRPSVGERVSVEASPVRYNGAVIAVLTRETAPTTRRRPSPLERAYLETARELVRMVAEGSFPFPTETLESQDAPRVGDGIIKLDGRGHILYASPNAVSALRRLGVEGHLAGHTLADLDLDDTAVRTAFSMMSPVTQEIETGEFCVALGAIPLVSGGAPTGALLLVRDVTDIRSRDKLLLTKDATIREIHHRVKNNLQTIASLLRLQSRRLSSPEAELALEESVRRIRSIALVHEVLSREPAGQVSFKAIVRPLLAMVEEGLVSNEAHIAFTIEGDPPELPVEIATPLAIVLTELVQNAVQHAFHREEEGQEPTGEVRVVMAQQDGDFRLTVKDDGVGLPEGFSLERDAGLGLQIVQTLVETELGGRIELANEKGTRATISLPTAEPLGS